MAACNRCGFCTSYCPTYNATGAETQSPRGRNQAFRALIEGSLKKPEEVREIINTCLLCGECTSVCFSEVPTAFLMIQARGLLTETYGIPKSLKWILYRLLPNPPLLRKLLKLLFLGKRLGISAFLNRLGFLKLISPPTAAAEHMMTAAPSKFLLDEKISQTLQQKHLDKAQHDTLVLQKKVSDLKKKGQPVPPELLKKSQEPPHKPKVAYIAACGSQYLKPSIGVASLKLCRALNTDLMIPDLLCCGLPAASYGVIERVKFFALENIKRIESGKFESLLMDDSSCTSHLKEYPVYFQDDINLYGRAYALNQKVREFSLFLWQRGLQNKLASCSWKDGSVAIHDPCKAQYGQKLTDPPRQLLKSIPGLKLVSIPDSDQCCGGGGTYSFTYPEISQEVLSKKVANVLSTGAKTVVTTSTSCLLQLDFGLRTKKADIQVLHLSEFLAKVLKL